MAFRRLSSFYFARVPREICRVALFTGALLVLSACATDVRLRNAPALAAVKRAQEASAAPAVAGAVASSARMVALAADGEGRAGAGPAATPYQPFHVGSVAKTMTAAVAAQLVEEGDLAWQSTIADVLPKLAEEGREIYRDVTLAQLLAHEAGLPAYADNESIALIPEFEGASSGKRRAFVTWLLEQPPASPPGEKGEYSNAGYAVVAVMLETVTGRPWEALVSERVFEPLDMESAGFGWPDEVWGHRQVARAWQPADPVEELQLPVVLAPAGDVHASVADMSRYCAEYLRAWQGRSEWLSADTVQRMFEPRLEGGLGWGVQPAFGYGHAVLHEGSVNTFFMIVLIIPAADRCFVAAANAGGREVEEDVIDLLQALAFAYLPRRSMSRADGNPGNEKGP